MRTTNLLILRGYTGGAPKAFGNGRIAKVSVATNRSWIDKTTGDRVEKTDWVTVTILNEQDAKFALANVRKGSPKPPGLSPLRNRPTGSNSAIMRAATARPSAAPPTHDGVTKK